MPIDRGHNSRPFREMADRAMKRLGSWLARLTLSAGTFLAIALAQTPANEVPGTRRLIIDLGGKQWKIHLTPGRLEVVAASIITVVFGVAIVFALIARRRAKQAEAAMSALKKEAAERARAEASILQL